jgi:H+/Cl- antiporter ClcA
MPASTVLVGLAAGSAGVGVVLLLRAVQYLAFGYTEDSFLKGEGHAPPARLVAALAVGGLIVGLGWWWLRRRVTAEDVSVTRAVREPGSRLDVPPTVADGVLQVIAVGAGASLGREGAPRQIGAAFAGWIGGRLHVTPAQRRTLLACGAGAGLASVYNVPFSGALFTLEILLASVALRDLVPAAITAGIATVVSWPVLSNAPTYDVAGFVLTRPLLVWALLAGPICGLVGFGFHWLMHLARTHAAKGWHAVVATVGVFTALGIVSAAAYPQLVGNGKIPAQLALVGAVGFALAGTLVILKPIATAACLAAGAIGGLLTPAVATGAVLGVFTGDLWNHVWPGTPVGDFALVGAAAVLAVTQRAPITATVLALEFVHGGLNVVGPMAIAVVLGMVTARSLSRDMTPIALAHVRERRAARALTFGGAPSGPET